MRMYMQSAYNIDLNGILWEEETNKIQQETKMNLNSAMQFDHYSCSYFYNSYFQNRLKRNDYNVKIKISKEIERAILPKFITGEATVNI